MPVSGAPAIVPFVASSSIFGHSTPMSGIGSSGAAGSGTAGPGGGGDAGGAGAGARSGGGASAVPGRGRRAAPTISAPGSRPATTWNIGGNLPSAAPAGQRLLE